MPDANMVAGGQEKPDTNIQSRVRKKTEDLAWLISFAVLILGTRSKGQCRILG